MPEFPLRILPRVGYSFAQFGQSRSVHREELGEFDSFRREEDSPEIDLYLDLMLSLEYDENDQLKFAEVINDEGEIFWEDVPLLEQPVSEVIRRMAAHGHTPTGPWVGVYAFPELGIRLWTQGPKDNRIVKGVGLVPEELSPNLRR